MTEFNHCTTTSAPEKENEDMTKETLRELYNFLVEDFWDIKKEIYLNSNEVKNLFTICEVKGERSIWGVPVYVDDRLLDNIMKIISGDEVNYIRIREKPDKRICPFVLENPKSRKMKLDPKL